MIYALAEFMEVVLVAVVYQLAVPLHPLTERLTVPVPHRLAFTAVGAAGCEVGVQPTPPYVMSM